MTAPGGSFNDLLVNFQSNDNAIRGAANNTIMQMRDNNFGELFGLLMQEMLNPNAAPTVRQAAGLIMKMCLDSRDANIRNAFAQSWMAIDDNLRGQIKQGLLQTLGVDIKVVAASAALVVSKIAAIEVPKGMWNDLLSVLINNMTLDNAHLRKSTLDTLGYLCEVLSADIIAQCVNAIMTAVIQGMRAEEPSPDVRLAGTKAFCNALEYVKAPFEAADQRDYIMTVVCQCAADTNPDIKRHALECLVKIVQFFYDKMENYMKALFQLTFNSIQNDVEGVALQAIEFWNTVGEEEIYLHKVEEAAREAQQPSTVTCVNYIRHALPFLVPLLLQTMMRQDPTQDEDTWNLSMAAGTCMDLCANAVGDDIVQHIFTFVGENMNSTDWHQREAAIYAFGSILEGVNSNAVSNLINTGLATFVEKMGDEMVLVGETASWTVGRICKFHARAIDPKFMDPLIAALLTGLGKHARVAVNCCWAFHNLAIAYDATGEATYVLTNYFGAMMENLLKVTDRPDAADANLRSAAYTAINVLIDKAPEDCMPAIFVAFKLLTERLSQTCDMPPDARQGDLQALICGVLQVITKKAGPSIAPYGNGLMTLYLRVFECKSATVHEEALLAIGTLADAMGSEFAQYMSYVLPWIKLGLSNVQEYQVCAVAIGVVGDIARALEEALTPFAGEIIVLLVQDLKDENLDRDVKPAIFSVFGDIALAIGAAFIDYLTVCMRFLAEGSQTTVDPTNEELVMYLNELRENILEGYTGIIQGLNGVGRADALGVFVDHIFSFIQHIYNDRGNRDPAVTRNAIGVLGDLAQSCGGNVAQYLRRDFVKPFIRECRALPDEDSVSAADFANRMVNEALGGR